MKKCSKLTAWILTLGIFITCADFQPLVAEAVTAVTDAYAAYDELLTKSFESVRDQITAMESLIASSPYQNTDEPRTQYVFGPLASPALTKGEGQWPILSTGQTIGDSANHSPVQYFNQTGIQSTAQMKAGGWLDDTKYDATAGAPTTENFFITIGGTQYIVDVEYEFVTRPYVRRYFFSAAAPNYRYYKLGDTVDTYSGTQKDYEIDVVTNWSTNLQTPDHTALKLSDGAEGWYDLSRYNAVYLKLAQHLEVKIAADGNDAYLENDGFTPSGDLYNRAIDNGWTTGKELDYHWDQSTAYADLKEDYQYDYVWWAADYNASTDTEDMPPGLAQAIATKQQIYDIVKSIRAQYAAQDDNYRADQGVINVDDPSKYAPEVWNSTYVKPDEISWVYTYYGMVRRGGNRADGKSAAGGNGVADLVTTNTESDDQFHQYQYDSGEPLELYDSSNVWCPTIVTYMHDWRSYGTPGLNADTLASDMDSTPVKWMPVKDAIGVYSALPQGTASSAVRDTSKAPAHIGAGSEAAYAVSLGLTTSIVNLPELFRTRYVSPVTGNSGTVDLDLFTTHWDISAQNDLAADPVINSTPAGAWEYPEGRTVSGDDNWTRDSQYAGHAFTNIHKLCSDVNLYWNTYWNCYLNDPGNLLLNGVFCPVGNHAPEITRDMLGFDLQTGFDTEDFIYNQLADVYMSKVYNLFLSVSGLFYADEVIELFGTDIFSSAIGRKFAVQGFDPQLVKDNEDLYNACVAQNLYTMFGEPYRVDDHADRDWGFSLSWVWACFPLGGDLDGPMEDTETTASLYNPSIYSTSDLKPSLTEAAFLLPMNYAPQYVRYTYYGFRSDATSETDAYRNKGHDFQYSWHGDDSTPPPTPTCSATTFDGYGPHGCEWIDSKGDWGGMSSCTCSGDPKCSMPGCVHKDSDCSCGPGNACGQCVITDGNWVSCDCGTSCGTKDCNCADTFEECDHPDDSKSPDITNNATHDNRTNEFHFHSYCDNNGVSKTDYTSAADHGLRSYHESIAIHVDNEVDLDFNVAAENSEGTTWSGIKDMARTEMLTQTFQNVQYLNIISYSIWALDKAEVRGLSSLLGSNTVTNATVNTSNGVISTDENTVLSLIGYDIDEATIDNDHGLYTDQSGDNTCWNNLEIKGRVANSFNIKSIGNLDPDGGSYDTNFVLVPETSEYNNITFSTVSSAFSTRIADNPKLTYFEDSGNNLVNNDPYAYKIMNYKPTPNTDDLYFYYDPMRQGGRSHSSFGGFTTQALARTLLTLDPEQDWSGNVTTARLLDANNYTSYCNSLRIQGDYLAIETQPGVYLTLVGSLYDTWDELHLDEIDADIDTLAEAKFRLIRDVEGVNRPEALDRTLSAYYSMQPWVPGKLSYILSRVNWWDHDDLPTVHTKSTQGAGYIDPTYGDCWIIHTFCYNLNDYYTSYWDQVMYTQGTNPMLARDIKVLAGSIQQQGSVNYWIELTHQPNSPDNGFSIGEIPGGKTFADIEINNRSKYGVEYLGTDSVMQNHITTVDLPSYFNIRYRHATFLRTDSAYDDNLKWYGGRTRVRRNFQYSMAVTVPIAYDSLETGIDLTEDVTNWRGKNNKLLMSDTNGKQLPYIGYQSAGDGTTSIIHTKNSNITQTGYTNPFGVPAYDSTKTFVSDIYPGATSVYEGNRSFSAFGLWTHHNYKDTYQNAVTTIQNSYKHTGNEAPDDTVDEGRKFGVYYPWISDINLNRFLPNGLYYSGQIYNVYKKVVEDADGYAGSLAAGSTLNRSDEIRVNADYTRQHNPQGNVSVYNLPNAVTIFNPVTTESAHYVSPSEYMPDGGNYGGHEGTDGSGNPTIIRGAYLQSFLKYITRDQRVAKVGSGGSVTGQEEYTVGGSSLLVTETTSSSSFHYELRVTLDALGEFTESAIDTKYYTMDDYSIRTEVLEPEIIGGTTGKTVQEITETSTYKISVSNTAGNWYSSTVNLERGDTLTWEDNAIILTKGSDKFNLPYSQWQEAYKAYEETLETFDGTYTNTNNFIPITQGMTINPLNATFDMPKGSTLEYKLFLERTDGGNLTTILPFDLNLPEDKFKTHVEHDTATNVHTIYIEALEDTTLNGLECTATQNFHLLTYAGSALKSSRVLLMKVGNSDTYVEGVTTISYFFEHESWSINSVEAWGAYNDSYVTISGSWEMSGYTATYERNTVYIQNIGGTVLVELNNSDPHKVPNTNWRYYVLGWKTADGKYILDINDSALAEGSTVELIPPIGKLDNYTLTAAYFDNLSDQGKLAVAFVDGMGYLMLTEWYLNGYDETIRHTLEWYGLVVEQFDIVSFGEETTTITNTLISWDLTSYEHRHEIWQYSYECVFRATGHLTFRCAYDVKYSMNLLHKVSLGHTDYLLDWVQIPNKVPTVVQQQRDEITGTYMSLDDEYILYWDNLADLSHTRYNSESTEISPQIWRGWDAEHGDDSYQVSGLTTNGSIKNSALDGLTADWWSTLTSNPAADLTDTTKWIYSKYVTFNVDMYGFTTGNSFTLHATYDPKDSSQGFNPTTPAFKPDGTPNNIVYIPAGTPVHLGYYLGDSADDNSGKFVDYGFENGTTQDPNNYKYTYHFWVPLEVGESNENVVVEYHVTNINNGDDDNANNPNDDPETDANQASWYIPNVTRVARTVADFFKMFTGSSDEWDQYIVRLGSTQNLNNVQRLNQITIENANTPDTYVRNVPRAQDYIRPNNSYTTSTVSIVGRMGSLTVVDTGDPRYQDSFKEGSATEFAITPIVKAVTRYTNGNTGEGHQIQFLTDVQDVRGRLVELDADSNGLENHPNYMYIVKNLTNTYCTQVFREWARNFKLPMTPEFSIHTEANLPMQKLGYEIYCSLETIGNYYGSAIQRPSGGAPSNYSDDYGQTKVQVRPVYIFIPADGSDPYALDVYYRRNGSYKLLNAGSAFASLSEAQTAGSSDTGPFYLQAAYDAQYSMSIETNSEAHYDTGSTFKLDQALMRRLVTEYEAKVTYEVIKSASSHSNLAVSLGITKTLLQPISLSTVTDPTALLDFKYYYGNPQIEFLREYNRTFIGGVNKQISDDDITEWTNNAKKYGQKWYFGIGLPSTSIFIKHGVTQFTDENIVNDKDGWILVALDTYAIGEKWVLHYESHVSDEGIVINNIPYDRDTWNFDPEHLPNLVPVSIYDTKTMSSGDTDTRGTF